MSAGVANTLNFRASNALNFKVGVEISLKYVKGNLIFPRTHHKKNPV